MSQFLNSLNEVRKNYKVYDEWEQKQADERARKEYLVTKLEISKDEIEFKKASRGCCSCCGNYGCSF